MPPRCTSRGLERKPQRELDEAWKVILTSDLAKGSAAAAAAIGWIELRVVESVEELCAELHAVSLIRTKFRVFEDCQVKVLHTVGAYVRFSARVAERTNGP